MKKLAKKLPIGIQSFNEMIENNYIYIDKTQNIYSLISSGKNYFLSRPRRFGKSLLVSTLKELFLGNKQLFKDLWISKSDYEWQEYSIVQLDFSNIPHENPEEFKQGINDELDSIAGSYNIDIAQYDNPVSKIKFLIRKLAQKSKVVFLVDEYDYPLLSNLKDPDFAEKLRKVLQNFYASVKSMSEHLRFVFLTGVTKISKTSLFSGFNNLQDITFSEKSATLLGYTQEEIEHYFNYYLTEIAKKSKVIKTTQDIITQMRCWYNGYRFSKFPDKVYNPFSVLLYLDSGDLKNYWFETGTPSFLIYLVKKMEYQVGAIDKAQIHEDETQPYDLDKIKLFPLMFYTGYLTIKSFNPETRNYQLTYPNKEVESSFLRYLFVDLTHVDNAKTKEYQISLKQALCDNNIELFMKKLKVLFADIPYYINIAQEKYYHTIFLLIMKMLGAKIEAEIPTNQGRIDAVMETSSYIYVIEFKLNIDSTKALQQIIGKQYYQKYLDDNKKIILIGIMFNQEQKNIGNWLIKEL